MSDLLVLENTLKQKTVNIPYGIDSAHLIYTGSKYIIPVDDVYKLQMTTESSLEDTIDLLANHYNILAEDIVIELEGIEYTPNEVIAARIEEAADLGVKVIANDIWNIEESISESVEVDDDEIINVLLYDISESISAGSGMYLIDPESVKFSANMVNIYAVDNEYLIEMSELNRYMDDNHIDSVREALNNILEANDLDKARVSLLYEAGSADIRDKLNKEQMDKIKQKFENRRKQIVDKYNAVNKNIKDKYNKKIKGAKLKDRSDLIDDMTYEILSNKDKCEEELRDNANQLRKALGQAPLTKKEWKLFGMKVTTGWAPHKGEINFSKNNLHTAAIGGAAMGVITGIGYLINPSIGAALYGISAITGSIAGALNANRMMKAEERYNKRHKNDKK